MSSIFFDNPLPHSDFGSARCVAWSRGEELPLLAVSEGSVVRIFRDEGEELEDYRQQGRVPCSALCWHPISKVLAIGWEDGTVSFMGPQSGGVQEDREVHREAAILCIVFNPAGTRCITTDASGVVGVWKTDQKGMVSRMCHYKKQGAHDKVVFRTLTAAGEPSLENPPFFFGGEMGIIYLADDFGLCSERNKIGGQLMLLEYFHQKDTVVVITKSAILVQFNLDAEGKVCNETKQKLTCGPNPEKLQGVWVGQGLLASSSQESIVHLWNLVDDESYILSLHSVDERNTFAGDKVTALDFNPRKRVLACGTRGGKVVQWRCSTLKGTPKGENAWQVLPPVSVADCAVDKVSWGPGESLLHVKTERNSVILNEAQLQSTVNPPYMAVQTSPAMVLLYHLDKGTRTVISPGFRVRGISIGGNYVMTWNQKQITVYDIESNGAGVSEHSSFRRENTPIAAAVLIVQGREEQIAIATGSKIEFTNLKGHANRSVSFSTETEGNPVCMDVKGPHLVAATSMNVIRVWNVSRQKEQLKVKPRAFVNSATDQPLGHIRSMRVNSDGSKVSLIVDQRMPGAPGSTSGLRVPDSRVFIYDTETDSFLNYNMGKSRVPVTQCWDSGDSRLLACEVVPQALCFSGEDGAVSAATTPLPTSGLLLRSSLAAAAAAPVEDPVHSMVTLFVAGSDRGTDRVLLQDTIPCADSENGGVPRMPVALVVPNIFFARQLGDVGGTGENPETAGAEQENRFSDGRGTVISKQVLKDFSGLETVDENTKKALLNFSYHLACGNTWEAYKSVKSVQSSGVWEKMSKMCVKTGRLDVAMKCIGEMGHARAASTLRACQEPEDEAKLAVLAVQLDMIEDAERLLRKCGRWDMLNQLYQACGEWDKALEIAQTKDRVHLKATHYAYAQHLESVEDVEKALAHFEHSGTYRTESPRLLCSLGLTDELDAYVERSEDPQLHRWYAQYLESKANLEGAAKEYRKAADWLSLCRVACFNKDLPQAQRICEETQDQAACYHLARHLESEGTAGAVKEAIHYYQVAGRVSHALRLAQDHGYDGDLMSLALSSDPVNMASAAKYYETKGQHAKAVILYQKAGYQKRALDLCFSARLFDALRKIADDLSADSDPEVLAKCAEFFMQHNQHDKAVHLLSMSHQYDRAVDLCQDHDVQITEDMAERMTPDKNSMDAAQRSEILQRIAKLCKKQGSFQLACKKFTQAGDKLKAMKSLLQSGDTEKIIFFAGTARQPEIYVLAGNYLQSLDWHSDPDIIKTIIQFYSKAKAYDKLATFYDACAQLEVDEFRDYEKAAGALKESLKYIAKAVGPGYENDLRVHALQNRIVLVERFAGIRKGLVPKNETVQACEEMVDMPGIDSSVRIGDIFAQLVEHHAETQNFAEAHRCVERMRAKNINLTPYVDQALLQTIYSAVGQPAPLQAPVAAGAAGPDGVGEEIDEEDDN